MTRLLLEGVSKVYSPNVEAVADIDLDVRSGEMLALVGPSGCGKSTLLRMIAGLESPTAGEIVFEGRRMNDVPPHQRNTAMVFQEDALQPHWSVRKNLEFGLKRCRRGWLRRPVVKHRQDGKADSSHHGKLTNGEIEHRISEAAALLGIGHLLDRWPWRLSGGERQRVALGRAMVRSPAVLLLDEPLSNLDARLRGLMRAEIKRLHQRLGVTTIYVTHDQQEAMTLGDRIAVMSAGRLLQVGAPLQVYDRPAHRMVAELLGSPPMNFVDGRIEQSGEVAVRFVGGGLQVVFSTVRSARLGGDIGRPVMLGIRPEHIGVHPAADLPTDVESLANITMVETLGDSAILHLRIVGDAPEHIAATSNHEELTSKQTGRWTYDNQVAVAVTIDPTNCYVFDKHTGRNLEANS